VHVGTHSTLRAGSRPPARRLLAAPLTVIGGPVLIPANANTPLGFIAAWSVEIGH
jgi:hypothetical protein